MSVTKTVVLCRKNEQPIPVDKQATFSFEGTTFRAEMEIDLTPALVSLPCEKCGKSTRDMLRALGIIDLPADDQMVDVMELIEPFLGSEAVDADYVSVIADVHVIEITDVDSMIPISLGSELGLEIEKHVKERLLNHMLDAQCFYGTEHVCDLLEAK